MWLLSLPPAPLDEHMALLEWSFVQGPGELHVSHHTINGSTPAVIAGSFWNADGENSWHGKLAVSEIWQNLRCCVDYWDLGAETGA